MYKVGISRKINRPSTYTWNFRNWEVFHILRESSSALTIIARRKLYNIYVHSQSFYVGLGPSNPCFSTKEKKTLVSWRGRVNRNFINIRLFLINRDVPIVGIPISTDLIPIPTIPKYLGIPKYWVKKKWFPFPLITMGIWEFPGNSQIPKNLKKIRKSERNSQN